MVTCVAQCITYLQPYATTKYIITKKKSFQNLSTAEYINSINLRNLNQVENLFGSIRSACQVAKAPNVCNLQATYATTMITNLNSLHSAKSNCEKDSGCSLVQYLTARLSVASDAPSETVSSTDFLYTAFPESESNFIEDEAILVTATSIRRKILQTCTVHTRNV